MTFANVTHVAVGVVLNDQDQVLVSQRHPGSHKGGLWEFPGGKKESHETIEMALQREFREELGITPVTFYPFTKILHHYPEKSVLLDVWVISEFNGIAEGKEGQAIDWRDLSSLNPADFPEANAAIIKRIRLPRDVAITPNLDSIEKVVALFELYAKQNVQLVQFRQTQLDSDEYSNWYGKVKTIAQSLQMKLMANQSIDTFPSELADGFHANSQTLMRLENRPVTSSKLFSASCHNLGELAHAQKVDADFVTLSPVNPSEKYRAGAELGWDQFSKLAAQVSLPVYALGGVGSEHMELARSSGAFGIAGITAYLNPRL
ncbi:MAG: Nudix family hydrolase [Gammaproteobacteria bacterium]|nr:Nudix family hydrolase [Gammaproteobacteria bacterium]